MAAALIGGFLKRGTRLILETGQDFPDENAPPAPSSHFSEATKLAERPANQERVSTPNFSRGGDSELPEKSFRISADSMFPTSLDAMTPGGH